MAELENRIKLILLEKKFNSLKKSLISFFIDLYSKLIHLINSSTYFLVFLYSFIFRLVFS